MEKRFGALSSSVDGQKLAATVTGVIKAVAGALVFFGLLGTVDADTLISNVGQLASLGFAMWGVAETVFGIIRKVIVAASDKEKE